MILDKIENAKLYAGIHRGIDEVLSLVTEYTAQNFPKEKRVLDGDNVFMLFPSYETHAKEEGQIEAHGKYIDVMYMVDGEETIYVKPTEDLRNITMPFDAEKDALLAAIDEDAVPVVLRSGSFIVLFPQDAHAPGCDVGAPRKEVKKIIGKVRL